MLADFTATALLAVLVPTRVLVDPSSDYGLDWALILTGEWANFGMEPRTDLEVHHDNSDKIKQKWTPNAWMTARCVKIVGS